MINLESLGVDLGLTREPKVGAKQILNEFLCECRPLCDPELIGYTEIFDLNLLGIHGQNLRILRLREDHRGLVEDENREDELRPVLSVKDYQIIRERCPNNVVLGIDLPGQEEDNGTWVSIPNFCYPIISIANVYNISHMKFRCHCRTHMVRKTPQSFTSMLISTHLTSLL